MASSCGSKLLDAADHIAWGTQGLRDGDFLRPRAIGVHDSEVYVIDTTGRVQVFDEDGAFQRGWRTPSAENGTPTAIAFAENRVIVPDTHYSQILEYGTDGTLLNQWGSYGTGEDEFIYPTGAAIDAKGVQYFSEYGIDAERVHVFSPAREFVRQWGSHGEAPGQFNRAMAIALGRDETLYVADTANHRIQCFTKTGELLRVVGEAGTAPGQLKFPHDLTIAPDGSILVSEYGSHRISRFTADGTFLRTYGSAGRGPGQYNGPRGVAASPNGYVFVADTDNHRIQRFSIEARG